MLVLSDIGVHSAIKTSKVEQAGVAASETESGGGVIGSGNNSPGEGRMGQRPCH